MVLYNEKINFFENNETNVCEQFNTFSSNKTHYALYSNFINEALP